MNKAIFLDRDGTINVDKNYVYRKEDFEFLPGAISGLKLLQSLGYLLFIITNQSGIARGFYTEEDLISLNNWILFRLEAVDVKIQKIYYCPHHPQASVLRYKRECQCRKPLLGLFEKAINEYSIDVDDSWAIGNENRDVSICDKYNCSGIIINNKQSVAVISENKHIYYSSDLYEAAKLISRM